MKYLDFLEEAFVVVSLAVMVIINFGNVLSRYLIHASWAFSEELVVILFVYNSFFAASLAYRKGAHLGFTFITDMMNRRGKKIAAVVSTIFTVLLMSLLVKYGIEMIQSQMMFDQRTPAMGLPEWIAGLSVPLGALVIILRVILVCRETCKECDVSEEQGARV